MNDQSDDMTENTIVDTVNDRAENKVEKTGPALIEKFVIRLPKGLRNKIKHLSEQNRRSMNSEIIMVLEKHIQNNPLEEQAALVRELSAQTDQSIDESHNITESGSLPDSELVKRLENLPEEKKLALLKLLG